MSLILHSGAGGILVMDTNECRALFVLFNKKRQKDAYGGHLKDVNPLALASSLMDPYMKRTTVVLLEQMTFWWVFHVHRSKWDF